MDKVVDLKFLHAEAQQENRALKEQAAQRSAKDLAEPTTEERCHRALARLLECTTHLEVDEPPDQKAKRRGSWTGTLRGASARFLPLMRELTEEAVVKREKRVQREEREQRRRRQSEEHLMPKMPAAKSRTQIGNEMWHMLKGRRDLSLWDEQHDDLADKRLRNKAVVVEACEPSSGIRRGTECREKQRRRQKERAERRGRERDAQRAMDDSEEFSRDSATSSSQEDGDFHGEKIPGYRLLRNARLWPTEKQTLLAPPGDATNFCSHSAGRGSSVVFGESRTPPSRSFLLLFGRRQDPK